MTNYEYLGNYPSNNGSDWCDGLQGVTHNAEHWIFTQKTRILKFHIGQDLRTATREHAVETSMPSALKGLGCNHFGDPDYLMLGDKGYLFIPVEGEGACREKPRLAVFRDDGAGGDFEFLDDTTLPYQVGSLATGRAGWCAISPQNRILYSSDNQINEDRPVFGYRVDFDELETNGRLKLVCEDKLELTEPGGDALRIAPYVQGGTFSPDGRLHLIAGRLFRDPAGGGIWVFDQDGTPQKKSSRSKGADFRYQFDTGWRRRQEPEGIAYWNTDTEELKEIRHAKVSGQLHAILLNKKIGDDHVWLKHYRLSPIPDSE